MGRRNKGPTQSRQSLARHIRDGGGRRQSVRRGGAPVQGKSRQAQLSRKRQNHAAVSASRTRPSRRQHPSAAAGPISGVILPEHRQGLLGILAAASEHRRIPTTATADDSVRANVLCFVISGLVFTDNFFFLVFIATFVYVFIFFSISVL